MLAYKFDENTKEYLGTQQAQPNPLEGGYLLPANCTFVAPPEYLENTIPVFENNEWVIKADNRGKWQVKLDDITFSKVDYIGERVGYQVISDEVYNNYQADNDRYKVIDGVFTDIIGTPEYEEIKSEEREENFKNQFFEIPNYGWFRKVPKGYSSAVESLNTAFNAVSILQKLPANTLIFYQEPDFTKPEECTEEWLIEHQTTNAEMSVQEFGQFYIAFMTAWNTEMHENSESEE